MKIMVAKDCMYKTFTYKVIIIKKRKKEKPKYWPPLETSKEATLHSEN